MQWTSENRLILRCLTQTTLLLAIVVSGGCATYTRADDAFKHGRAGFVVDLPDGWLRYTPARPAYVLTRDGLRLETITIRVTRQARR